MTTNRKQHELAALAAGLVITWKEGHCNGGSYEGAFIGDQPWRPKEDDGDALRLAVRLEINVLPNMEAASARHPGYTKWCNEDARTDPYAATRLAIFRAAVEIEKAVQREKGLQQIAQDEDTEDMFGDEG